MKLNIVIKIKKLFDVILIILKSIGFNVSPENVSKLKFLELETPTLILMSKPYFHVPNFD